MKNICFYVSDYGYGHATRDIAMIRAIKKSINNVKIHVKTDCSLELIRQSVKSKNMKLIKTKNDVGVITHPNRLSVDKEKTRELIKDWLKTWKRYIETETRYYEKNRIDLIISDISPQPFIISKKIPSIAMSNFTWYYVYHHLFGDVKEVEEIKDAYREATLALVLPFNEDMKIFSERKKIGLVVRNVTENKNKLRQHHGVSGAEMLVFVSVGYSSDSPIIETIKTSERKGIKFLVSSNVETKKDVIKIPENETESQNYISMCDLVVSKGSYGVVSESVNSHIPLLLLRRNGFIEGDIYIKRIKEFGVGKEIQEQTLSDGSWVEELENIQKYKKLYLNLPKRYRKDGCIDAVEKIKEFIQ